MALQDGVQNSKVLTLVEPGSFASYLVQATAALGSCYILWKGWSFSDVMFETLAKHPATGLDDLDQKLDEVKETFSLIQNKVDEFTSKLFGLRDDCKSHEQTLSGLEEKIDRIESKQDEINRLLNLLLTKYPPPANKFQIT